jgi:hypothetical protein
MMLRDTPFASALEGLQPLLDGYAQALDATRPAREAVAVMLEHYRPQLEAAVLAAAQFHGECVRWAPRVIDSLDALNAMQEPRMFLPILFDDPEQDDAPRPPKRPIGFRFHRDA